MSFSEDLYRVETSQSIFELNDILNYMASFFVLRSLLEDMYELIKVPFCLFFCFVD